MEFIVYFADRKIEPPSVTLDAFYECFHMHVAKEILTFQMAKRIAHLFIRLLKPTFRTFEPPISVQIQSSA